MYPDEILEADNREPLTRGDAASDNTKRCFDLPRHRGGTITSLLNPLFVVML